MQRPRGCVAGSADDLMQADQGRDHRPIRNLGWHYRPFGKKRLFPGQRALPCICAAAGHSCRDAASHSLAVNKKVTSPRE